MGILETVSTCLPAPKATLLREHELHLGRGILPVRPVIRRDHVVVGGRLRIRRQRAEMEDTCPTPPPTGTVRRWLLSAFQLAVMIGALVM